MKILKIGIVEDDLIIAQSIGEMLCECGYEVARPAKRYSEAIAMIESEAPDLLLLDIVILGPMDGIEVARTVDKIFGIPYIFLTANTDFETIARAKEVRPSAFLAKPITKAQLFAAIEIAVAAHMAREAATPSPPVAHAAPPGVFVKKGTAFRRVGFADILVAESRDNYLRLRLTNGEAVTFRSTLSEFLTVAPGFVQTHRGFAVAAGMVTALNNNEVAAGAIKVPVSRTYRAALLLALGLR